MSHCANQKANSFFKSDICGWSTKEKKTCFKLDGCWIIMQFFQKGIRLFSLFISISINLR